MTFPDVPDPYWVGIDPQYNPGDSIAWLGRLEQALRARQWRIQVFDNYYRGKHRLAFASPKFRQAFGGLFNEFADDWCQLVVDAVDERLAVQGFRLGTDADKGDQDAWRIWQSNNLDAESRMGHVEALVREECSAIVWADPDNDKIPSITIEDPSQVIVAFQPGSRKKRLAALKMWTDEDGRDNATVYLPDAVYKYRAKNRSPLATTRINQFLEANREAPSGGAGVGRMPVSLLPIAVASPADSWEPRETPGEPWPLPNPMGVVPVVPIVNRPRLLGPGESEIRKVIPLQDAINKQVADMMVASEFTAFRQRYVTGMDIPVDAQGNQVEPFVMSADRLFIAENPTAKFGEFSETNLGAYVKSIEMMVQHIASQTRTPPHYFYMSGHFPSGEALALDTSVKTSSGWTTMGEVKVGDELVDDLGSPCRVTEVFEVMHDRPCYRVRFDDGVEVIADAGHRWTTSHYPSRAAARRVTSVVTTEEIVATLTTPRGKKRQQAHHWIPLAAPFDGPAIDVPVDPYVLGCWLGDGSRGHGHLTCHVDDSEHFAAEWCAAGEAAYVYAPAPDRPTIRRVHAGRSATGTLRGRLTSLGILQKKRIPETYFEGSVKQRLALLQGLMDTDGTVNFGQGSVSFSSCWEPLAQDVLRLILSLGHKARLAPDPGDGHGFRISWSALDVVFRLPRKVERQRVDWPLEGAGRRVRGRYIVAVEPVPSVPVRCIQVDSPSHLFLVTEALVATHNSIKSAETGLVAKCRSKQLYFGEAWEEVIRLAFRVLGDKRADIPDTETIWRDCESRSEGEHIDASLKKLAAGVPQRQIWEDMGYTQAQIDRFKQMRAEEAAEQAALSIGLGPVLGAAGVPNTAAPGGVSTGTATLAPDGTVGGTQSGRPHEAINVPGAPLPFEVTAARVSL